MNLFPDLKATTERHLAVNPSDSIYLLIDSAGMSGLYREIRKYQVGWATLFDTTREHGALSVAPVLIMIGRNSSLQTSKILLRWISEQTAEGSSLIMLASRLPINELKESLALRLDVKISENMEAMLRFFDARIFENLTEVLTLEQMALLCGPARKWWYVNRMGEITEIEREFEYVESAFYRLELSEKQEFALINVSEPDQVLHVLINAIPKLEPLLPKDKYRFIADSIRSASHLGLYSISDFVLYSAMVTLRGPDFEALPYWKSAIAEFRANRISFADAVAASDDIAWEAE